MIWTSFHMRARRLGRSWRKIFDKLLSAAACRSQGFFKKWRDCRKPSNQILKSNKQKIKIAGNVTTEATKKVRKTYSMPPLLFICEASLLQLRNYNDVFFLCAPDHGNLFFFCVPVTLSQLIPKLMFGYCILELKVVFSTLHSQQAVGSRFTMSMIRYTSATILKESQSNESCGVESGWDLISYL